MKLRDAQLERHIRRRIKLAIRGSRYLWKEYKRRRKRFRAQNVVNASIIWHAALLFFFVTVARNLGHSLSARLFLLSLYLTATILLRSAALTSALYHSQEFYVMFHFPLADRDFFRHQISRYFLRSAALFIMLAAFYLYEASVGGLNFLEVGVSLAVACVQWLLIFTLALALIRFSIRVNLNVSIALWGVMLLSLFWRSAAGALSLIRYLLPAWWLSTAWEQAVFRTAPFLWPLFVLLAGLGIVLLLLVRQLRDRFSTSEMSLSLSDVRDEEVAAEHELQQAAPSDAGVADPEEWLRARQRFQAAQMAGLLRQGGILERPDWEQAGWIERATHRILSKRQRAVAEFLLADQLGWWSANYKKAALYSLPGLALAWVAPKLPVWPSLGAYVGALFLGAYAVMSAAPVFGGAWKGFAGEHASMFFAPLNGLFPIGYWEASKVLLKCNAIRLTAAAPLLLAWGAAAAVSFHQGPADGLYVALVAWLMFLTQQPLMILFKHSKGTNDSRRFTWAALPLFALLLLWMVLALLSSSLMFLPLPRGLLIGSAVSLCSSVIPWAYYGWLYNRKRIDLLTAGQT